MLSCYAGDISWSLRSSDWVVVLWYRAPAHTSSFLIASRPFNYEVLTPLQ